MRTFLWIFIPTALVFLLVFLLTRRMRVRLQYGEDRRPRVLLSYGRLRFLTLPPRKKQYRKMSGRKLRRLMKKEKQPSLWQKLLSGWLSPSEKKTKKKKGKNKPARKAPPKKEKPFISSPDDILELLRIAKQFLEEGLYRHLHSRIRLLRLSIAAGGADTTAYAYSAVMQALTAVFALLDGGRSFRIDSREAVSVTPDFDGGKTEVLFDIELACAPVHLIAASIRAGVRLLKKYLQKDSEARSNKTIQKKENHKNGE